MVVPTIPRPYTIAEVEADPVRLNSRLGTYTNFVNLLDLAAIACPSGMRGDGLPSSLTLIGPSGADGSRRLAAEIQARSGVSMGATGPPFRRWAHGGGSRLPAASRSRWSARTSPDCRSIPNSSRSAPHSCEKRRRQATTAFTRCRAPSRRSPVSCGWRRERAPRSGSSSETLDKAAFGAFVAGDSGPARHRDSPAF